MARVDRSRWRFESEPWSVEHDSLPLEKVWRSETKMYQPDGTYRGYLVHRIVMSRARGADRGKRKAYQMYLTEQAAFPIDPGNERSAHTMSSGPELNRVATSQKEAFEMVERYKKKRDRSLLAGEALR